MDVGFDLGGALDFKRRLFDCCSRLLAIVFAEGRMRRGCVKETACLARDDYDSCDILASSTWPRWRRAARAWFRFLVSGYSISLDQWRATFWGSWLPCILAAGGPPYRNIQCASSPRWPAVKRQRLSRYLQVSTPRFCTGSASTVFERVSVRMGLSLIHI